MKLILDLTQITFELYERRKEYSLRIGFSPGAHDPNLIDLQIDSRHGLSVAPRRWLTDHLPVNETLELLQPPIVAEETIKDF